MGREKPAPMIPVHVEPPKIGREAEEQLKTLAQQAHEAAANIRALGDAPEHACVDCGEPIESDGVIAYMDCGEVEVGPMHRACSEGNGGPL